VNHKIESLNPKFESLNPKIESLASVFTPGKLKSWLGCGGKIIGQAKFFSFPGVNTLANYSILGFNDSILGFDDSIL
jgi:hypothetical protein